MTSTVAWSSLVDFSSTTAASVAISRPTSKREKCAWRRTLALTWGSLYRGSSMASGQCAASCLSVSSSRRRTGSASYSAAEAKISTSPLSFVPACSEDENNSMVVYSCLLEIGKRSFDQLGEVIR
eukprot:scaffold259919_cov31-Tisochrysis_lutea.AAC.10